MNALNKIANTISNPKIANLSVKTSKTKGKPSASFDDIDHLLPLDMDAMAKEKKPVNTTAPTESTAADTSATAPAATTPTETPIPAETADSSTWWSRNKWYVLGGTLLASAAGGGGGGGGGDSQTYTITTPTITDYSNPTLTYNWKTDTLSSSSITGRSYLFKITDLNGNVQTSSASIESLPFPTTPGYYNLVEVDTINGRTLTSNTIRLYIGDNGDNAPVEDTASKSTIFIMSGGNDVVRTNGGTDHVWLGDGSDVVYMKQADLNTLTSGSSSLHGENGYDILFVEGGTATIDFAKLALSTVGFESIEEISATTSTTMTLDKLTPANIAAIMGSEVGTLLTSFTDTNGVLSASAHQMVFDIFDGSAIKISGSNSADWVKAGEVTYDAGTAGIWTYTVFNDTSAAHNVQLVIYSTIANSNIFSDGSTISLV